MFLYRIRTDTIKDEQNRDHTVYGVDVFKRIRSIPDIFTSKGRAKLFVCRCNQLQPAPVHIDDIVYDTIVE